MQDNFTLPYRVARTSMQEAVSHWTVHIGSKPYEDPDHIAGWDALLSFRCTRRIVIDMDAFLAETGLVGQDADCVLLITSITGQGRLRKILHEELLPYSGEFERLVVVEPESSGLASELVLETTVALRNAREAARAAFVAWRPGSRLWSDKKRLPVEGTGARPVMRAIAFSDIYPGSLSREARYFIDLMGIENGESAISDSITIYLNTESGFAGRIQQRDPHALNDLYEGVALQLCLHVLNNGLLNDVPLTEYEPGSVGYTVAIWLSSAFGPIDYNGLQALARNEPARFMLGIQAGFERTGALPI